MVAVVCFLPGRAKDLSGPPRIRETLHPPGHHMTAAVFTVIEETLFVKCEVFGRHCFPPNVKHGGCATSVSFYLTKKINDQNTDKRVTFYV